MTPEETFFLKQKEMALNALLEITQAINTHITEENLYKIYNFTLRGNLHIQKMALWVNDFGKWSYKAGFGSKIKVENDCFENIYQQHTSQVSLVQGSVFKDFFSDFEIVIPIFKQEQAFAFIFVTGNQIDANFIQTLTSILIVAIENRKLAQKQLEQEVFRKELDIATQVQQRLIPKNLPQTPTLEVAALYMPHSLVGGDYYDFVELENGNFLFCIADVSGKGIAAAMMMANFQASLRTLLRQTQNLRVIVNELNYLVLQNAQGENFITLFIAHYEVATKKLSYINAGHNPPFLLQNKQLSKLESGTTVLGIFEPLPFITENSLLIEHHSFIFAYTDGLNETLNPQEEQFGEERIANLLQKNNFTTLENWHQAILQELLHFKKNLHFPDDITLLSCKITP
ncbi:MAG: PP2C family protein-serine/threonine phosphatase [Thermonemataceae bacterium]|nr:PP2C family protein-serine/threonine phosphatase [Thermonemataceae bacterium]